MAGELNAPMGMAEGFNGITQGGVGALKGGDTKPSMSSSFPPSGGANSVLDAGTLMALKAIMPALAKQKKPTGPVQANSPSQGSTEKQIGQPQQQSPQPRSPGGPGVTSVGNGANLTGILQALFGGR